MGRQAKKQKLAARDGEEGDVELEEESSGEPGPAGGRTHATSTSGDESSEEESEGDEDEDEDEQDTVDVTFDFFDPKEIDYKGLRTLLVTYLDGKTFHVEELVNTIISQSTVGSVVKNAEDLDPIGVLTVLNLRRYAALRCLEDVRSFLTEKCPDDAHCRRLAEAWDAPGTGLLVSERLLNCPPQLAPPLLQGLFEELAWALEDEPTQELRDSFRFERFLCVSRVYTDPAAAPAAMVQAGGPAAVGGKKKKKQKQQALQPLVVYARPEDEFLHRHASWSFTFGVPGDARRQGELARLRLVMLLTAPQLSAAREELDVVVGNVARGLDPQPAQAA